jgi:hypothetical protein
MEKTYRSRNKQGKSEKELTRGNKGKRKSVNRQEKKEMRKTHGPAIGEKRETGCGVTRDKPNRKQFI